MIPGWGTRSHVPQLKILYSDGVHPQVACTLSVHPLCLRGRQVRLRAPVQLGATTASQPPRNHPTASSGPRAPALCLFPGAVGVVPCPLPPQPRSWQLCGDPSKSCPCSFLQASLLLGPLPCQGLRWAISGTSSPLPCPNTWLTLHLQVLPQGCVWSQPPEVVGMDETL